MRVHDSQAYRKMDVTRESISRVLELREIFLSIKAGFSLVNASVFCVILNCISGSSVITEPRYLKLVSVSSLCPFTLISVIICHDIFLNMLMIVGESRHPYRTPTVVWDQSPMLLLKETALVALS